MFVELLYSVLMLLSFLSCYHYCSDDWRHLYGLIAAVVNVAVSVVTFYRLLFVIVTPYHCVALYYSAFCAAARCAVALLSLFPFFFSFFNVKTFSFDWWRITVENVKVVIEDCRCNCCCSDWRLTKADCDYDWLRWILPDVSF